MAWFWTVYHAPSPRCRRRRRRRRRRWGCPPINLFFLYLVCGDGVRYVKGHSGRIAPGDLQWMSAARGIMHSEVPAEKIEAHGLQMWAGIGALLSPCLLYLGSVLSALLFARVHQKEKKRKKKKKIKGCSLVSYVRFQLRRQTDKHIAANPEGG